MTVKLRTWNVLAWITLLMIAFLSLMNLQSADFYAHEDFHEAQTVWFIIGLIVMVFASRIELSIVERLSMPLFLVTLVLLLATLIFGKEVNAAKRWIDLFGITRLQPSELSKIAVTFVTAAYLNQLRATEPHTLRRLARPLAYMGLTCFLILVEPDLGTATLVGLIFFSVVFFDGVRLRSVLKLAPLVAVAVPGLWFSGAIKEYQKDRVRIWLHAEPEQLKQLDKGLFDKYMQPKQALWAVGSGGTLGRGIHQAAKTRLRYLFGMQTDFVLATFAEEHGFVGMTLLLMLYFYLVFWTWLVSTQARDRFGALVSFGTGAMIAWQCWINLGMVLGLVPVVGITFPLMSYGGSSTLITLFGLGLVHNVARTAAQND
jgi:rod shape determining protein RodA